MSTHDGQSGESGTGGLDPADGGGGDAGTGGIEPVDIGGSGSEGGGFEPDDFLLNDELASYGDSSASPDQPLRLIIGGQAGQHGRMEVFALDGDGPPKRVENPSMAFEAYQIFGDAVEHAGGQFSGITDLGGGLSVVDTPGQPLYVVPTEPDPAA